MTERLVPFDPQPIGDSNVWLTPYVSPCGERFHNKAATEGEGYETQFFHIPGDPVDVRRVDGVWYWVFDDEENSDMSERLDEIRQRCAAATPGDWWVLPDDSGNINVVIGDQEDRVCEFHNGECLPAENAVFVSRARTDIPYLLDELARLNELLSVYKGWKDAIEDSGDDDGWAVALRWKQENAALTSKVAALEADAERHEQTYRSALCWLKDYRNDADNATHARRIIENAIHAIAARAAGGEHG